MIGFVTISIVGIIILPLGVLFLRYLIRIKKTREALVAEYMKFADDFANADWLSLGDDEWRDFIGRAGVLQAKMEEYQIDGGKFFAVVTLYYNAASVYKNTEDDAVRQEISATLRENKKLLLAALLEENIPR